MKSGKRVLVGTVLIVVLVGLAAGAKPAAQYFGLQGQVDWRQAAVKRGTIVSVVNSTGTIKPVLEVKVGSFVSGPISELFVDFNQKVTKDQELAKIDPRLFQAAVDREQAVLGTRKAEVKRIEALLKQATNAEERAVSLEAENPDFISAAEMDQFHFTRLSLEAQLSLARAAIKQAEASLKNAQANLDFTVITSPVDGIIIDRKIDKGQTLAAQFQTPEMFVVAPDMDKKIYVYASVDEADIGLIRAAQRDRRPVKFTVDAYPDDLFEGVIEEVRFSSTTTQNVVTYPVVVAAPNPDLKLLPGMTAAISFEIARAEDALRIPNAALRFYPEKKYVRSEDHQVLEGFAEEEGDDETASDALLSATEKADARKRRNQRHVWVADKDGKLRAVEVEVGLSDSRYTEIVSADLQENDQLVTGIKPKQRSW